MKSAALPIYFHFLNVHFQLQERRRLKAFILSMFKLEKTPLEELHYIFCPDAYLLELNMAYLKHDTYTDIITFSLSEKDAPIISDIYISIDRVRENATILKTTFKEELHRVLFHGVLHLCGYSDKTKKEQHEMRRREDYYLKKYFVSRETL